MPKKGKVISNSVLKPYKDQNQALEDPTLTQQNVIKVAFN